MTQVFNHFRSRGVYAYVLIFVCSNTMDIRAYAIGQSFTGHKRYCGSKTRILYMSVRSLGYGFKRCK